MIDEEIKNLIAKANSRFVLKLEFSLAQTKNPLYFFKI